MIFHDTDIVFDDEAFPSVSLAIDERHARYRYLDGIVADRRDGGDCILVGWEELEDEDFFRLAHLRYQNIYRFIAVEPFTDLKIEPRKAMDPLLHQSDAPEGTPHEIRCKGQHKRCAQHIRADGEGDDATAEPASGFPDKGREPRQRLPQRAERWL